MTAEYPVFWYRIGIFSGKSVGKMGGPVLRIGIDIGSTTVKVVLLDDQDRIVFKTYERHMSKAVSYTHLDVYKRQVRRSP